MDLLIELRGCRTVPRGRTVHDCLLDAYAPLGYEGGVVPKDGVERRADFVQSRLAEGSG